MKAKGAWSSAFDIRAGNVDSVTVRRFACQLYLNYTPNGAFNTGTEPSTVRPCQAQSSRPLRRQSVTQIARSTTHSACQIVADTIGTIKLSASGPRTSRRPSARSAPLQQVSRWQVPTTLSAQHKPDRERHRDQNDFFILDVLCVAQAGILTFCVERFSRHSAVMW